MCATTEKTNKLEVMLEMLEKIEILKDNQQTIINMVVVPIKSLLEDSVQIERVITTTLIQNPITKTKFKVITNPKNYSKTNMEENLIR